MDVSPSFNWKGLKRRNPLSHDGGHSFGIRPVNPSITLHNRKQYFPTDENDVPADFEAPRVCDGPITKIQIKRRTTSMSHMITRS